MRDDDLDEELRTHLDMEIEERMARGLGRAEAERSARREFGSVLRAKEATRDTWRWRSLERLAQDLRYAARLLRRNPTFACAVVVSIALGVGAQTAVFSVVDAVLLRPLRFAHADRLVSIAERPSRGAAPVAAVSGPDFADFHDQATSFEHLAAYLTFTFPLTDTDDPVLVQCTGVSPGFFEAVGLKPVLGRVYTAQEYYDDGPSIVIGYGFWQRRFGGDPLVLGKIVSLNHAADRVIGVMAPAGDLFRDTDIWAVYTPKYEWARQRDNRFLSLIGLLKPGVSSERAGEELQAIYRRMPGVDRAADVSVAPLKEQMVGSIRGALMVLLAAVGLVLLIACANVANLLLARGAARRREIATRHALGASRGRLIRQFLTESLLIAAIGGAAGTALAAALVSVFVGMSPGWVPRADDVRVDGFVLAFAIAVSLLAALVVSVAPVVAITRGELHGAVKMRGTGGPIDRWTRGALVAAELGIASVLLVGAGLLGRSFWRLLNVTPGFRSDHVLTLRLRVPDERVATSFYPDLIARVASRTGVEAAAVSDCLPTEAVNAADLLVPGRAPDPLNVPSADACFVSGGYFRTLRIPLVAGRPFGSRDGPLTPAVAIVSESAARALWPGTSALGRQVAVNYRALGRPTEARPSLRTVVGVVADVRQHGLDVPPRMAVYLPYRQDETRRSLRAMVLFARTAGAPDAAARAIQGDVRALAPDVPVQTVSTLDAAVHRTFAPRTFALALLGAFAAFALLLAAVGLYGVVSYTAARRTREIAIRMALGARRSQVLGAVLGQELRWIAIGLLAGLFGAWSAAHLLRGMLFGVGPGDAMTFGGVAAALALVALVACWSPASRAVRTDPLAALREE